MIGVAFVLQTHYIYMASSDRRYPPSGSVGDVTGTKRDVWYVVCAKDEKRSGQEQTVVWGEGSRVDKLAEHVQQK